LISAVVVAIFYAVLRMLVPRGMDPKYSKIDFFFSVLTLFCCILCGFFLNSSDAERRCRELRFLGGHQPAFVPE